eukprot:Hpha_TRINITY_DN16518_c0_g1::TRINITY_DN16518_c0_g1_i2::g.134175::m.134175
MRDLSSCRHTFTPHHYVCSCCSASNQGRTGRSGELSPPQRPAPTWCLFMRLATQLRLLMYRRSDRSSTALGDHPHALDDIHLYPAHPRCCLFVRFSPPPFEAFLLPTAPQFCFDKRRRGSGLLCNRLSPFSCVRSPGGVRDGVGGENC